jgi:ABC-type multidrug transport system fused ATPase/permease subunit
VGEKQLVCIARALLRDSRLVLVDEATANIDTRTDQLIQQALRDCFQSATVLTIAHRLHTVMSCDRIAVLAEGRLVEFDTPQRLLQAQGTFYSLYQQSIAHSTV